MLNLVPLLLYLNFDLAWQSSPLLSESARGEYKFGAEERGEEKERKENACN